jgi:hypothetical protein
VRKQDGNDNRIDLQGITRIDKVHFCKMCKLGWTLSSGGNRARKQLPKLYPVSEIQTGYADLQMYVLSKIGPQSTHFRKVHKLG